MRRNNRESGNWYVPHKLRVLAAHPPESPHAVGGGSNTAEGEEGSRGAASQLSSVDVERPLCKPTHLTIAPHRGCTGAIYRA